MSIVGILAITLPTKAGTITDYTLIGNYVTNTATGQEWLQWTETRYMNVNTAVNQFSSDGWRLATISDMAGLYNDFFNETTWLADENIDQTNEGLTTYDSADNSLIFGSLFGWTAVENSVIYPNQDVSWAITGNHVTYALFGGDEDGDNLYNRAWVNSQHTSCYPSPCTDVAENAHIWADSAATQTATRHYGVALIRDGVASTPSEDPTSVSEPSSFISFCIGILGLGYIRRKAKVIKQKNVG
jgi:hypothetical protein